MLTTSKKETSANGGQPLKTKRKVKYDILVDLQKIERCLLVDELAYARRLLEEVIKELKNAKEEAGKIQLQPDISPILQEADKALLAKNPVVAHACLRLAITESTVSS